MQPDLKNGLVITDMGGEVLVYDAQSSQAHSVDGDVANVVRTLSASGELNMDSAEVAQAVQMLENKGLLAQEESGMGRRDFMKRWGVAAAAVPVIASVNAMPASAASTDCVKSPGNAGACTECGAGAAVNFNPFADPAPPVNTWNCTPCSTSGCDCSATTRVCAVRMQAQVIAYNDPNTGTQLGWNLRPNTDDVHRNWECAVPNDGAGAPDQCDVCIRNCTTARANATENVPAYNPVGNPHYPIANYPTLASFNNLLIYACCTI